VVSVWRLYERLYDKLCDLVLEVFRFSAVGFAGLVVTDVGANLLHYQGRMGKLASVAIASLAATALTFLGSRYWTFRHCERAGAGRETALFFAMNGIGLAVSEGCVGLTYPLGLKGGVWYNVALNGGNALATVFRYWSYRKWVWPSTPSGSRASADGGTQRQAAGVPRVAA
jgi:putative flippase GtrA